MLEQSKMTAKRFWLSFLFAWVVLALVKVWFFNNPIFSNAGFQQIVFWALTGIIGIAIVRRFGIISFFEALFIIFIWTVGFFLLDFFIISNYTGAKIFSGTEYWFGMLIMDVSIFIFHKKRHLAVRKHLHDLQHAKEHGHGHGEQKKH